MRCVLGAFFLLLAGGQASAQVSYPEVFEQFITGWVHYDEGAYAASFRAFKRAKALDPAFYPARDGMIASLKRMGLPEFADYIVRREALRKQQAFELEPKLAFWGVFSDQSFEVVGAEAIEIPLLAFLRREVALPVVEVSPTSRAWVERERMAPCQFNMLVLLTSEGSGDIVARVHLIEAFDVEQGNELDLVAELPRLSHSQWTIDLRHTTLPEFLKTSQASDALRGLLDGEWQNPDQPFIIDPETAQLPPLEEIYNAGEFISKLALGLERPSEQFLGYFKRVYRGNLHQDRHFIEHSWRLWMYRVIPEDDPARPWVLISLAGQGYRGVRLYPEFYRARHFDNIFVDELLEDFPDHPTTKQLEENIRKQRESAEREAESKEKSALDAYNQARTLIARRGKWREVASLLGGVPLTERRHSRIVESVEKIFQRYGKNAISAIDHQELYHFSSFIRRTAIVLAEIDPIVRESVDAYALHALKTADWNAYNYFFDYMAAINHQGDKLHLKEMLQQATPSLVDGFRELPILRLRMRLADSAAILSIYAGEAEQALEFIELGLLQLDAEPIQSYESDPAYVDELKKERFVLWTTQARALFALKRYEELEQHIEATLAELDGEAITYYPRLSGGTNAENYVGIYLLKLKDRIPREALSS